MGKIILLLFSITVIYGAEPDTTDWSYRWTFGLGAVTYHHPYHHGGGFTFNYGIKTKKNFTFLYHIGASFNSITKEGESFLVDPYDLGMDEYASNFSVSNGWSFINRATFGGKYIGGDIGIAMDFYNAEEDGTYDPDGHWEGGYWVGDTYIPLEYSNYYSGDDSWVGIGVELGIRGIIPIKDKTLITVGAGVRLVDKKVGNYFDITFGILGKKRQSGKTSGTYHPYYYHYYYPTYYY